MPKAVHDLAKKLQSKGMPESKSWAIAYTVMNKKKQRGRRSLIEKEKK